MSNEHWCRFAEGGRVVCRCGWSGSVSGSFRHLAAAQDCSRNLPQMDDLCPNCWGTGELYDAVVDEELLCAECDGVGYVPTEVGAQLLLFITRHHPKLRGPR